MRRLATIAVLGALLLTGISVSPTADAQATQGCPEDAELDILFCDNFQTDQGWTRTVRFVDSDQTAQWSKTTNGNGDAHAWFAGDIHPATGEELGYRSHMSAQLTSPTIDVSDYVLSRIQYDISGGSEDCCDELRIFMSWNGGDYQLIHTTAKDEPTWLTMQHSLAGMQDGAMQLRFEFFADVACDSYVREDEGAFCGSSSYEGWRVDNVVVYGEPVPPFEPPTLGKGNPGNQPPEVIDVTISDSAVSIPDESVTITASTEDDSGVVVTRLLMQNEHGDVLDVGLTKTSETPGGVEEPTEQTWSITLQGTDARLFTGTYTGGLFAYDADGGIGGTSQTALSMGVSTSAPAPTVDVVEYDASAEILLSPENALRFLVGSEILAGVRYTSVHEDGAAIPSFKFPSPYVLHASSLLPGRQTLSVIAEDRAHREVEMQLLVVVDGDAPDLRLFEVPTTYAGVASEVHFITKDAIEHSVVFTLNGTVTRIPGGKDIDHRMPFQFDAPGQYGWSLRAEDSAGNRLFETGKINVSVVPTDVALTSLRLGDSHPLLGDAVSFVVEVAQQGGVIPVPVAVDFQVGDWEETHTTTVAVASKQSVTASNAFPVGTYTVLASAASTLPHHNDTDLDNQIQGMRFEVFLGKTVTPNGTYWIRADERGLPSAAVDANNVSYELRLVEFEGRTQYNFTAGGQDWYWDPLQRVTTNTVEAPAKKEDAPALPLLAVLALLGVLARRRK